MPFATENHHTTGDDGGRKKKNFNQPINQSIHQFVDQSVCRMGVSILSLVDVDADADVGVVNSVLLLG